MSRPRAEVLLLGRDAAECGRWKFLLETRGHFRVTTSTCVVETLELLSMIPETRAMLTTVPGDLGCEALTRFSRGVPVVLFGVRCCPAGTASARVIADGEGLAERLIDAVKTACARKRGPRKLNVLDSLQLSRQLRIERDGTLSVLELDGVTA